MLPSIVDRPRPIGAPVPLPGDHVRRARRFLVVLAWIGAACAGEPAAAAWPTPVPGWVPVQPGEHPRLFFRKADLPELKRRAQTAEGKAILARLRFLLGGGEEMPKHFSQATKGYDKAQNLPIGAYTLWHGMGFGLLYQLSGERRYADLGRQCVEKAFAGVRDRDDRLSWVDPPEFMRAGPSISAIAEAYDLCYDGWDEAFRTTVAKELQDYNRKAMKSGKSDGMISLERMALDPFMKPTSNHHPLQVGGAGICVLAINGDPGTDPAKLTAWVSGAERNLIRVMTTGYGDGGYFHEHDGPGIVGATESLVPSFQAWKFAAGKDFLSSRPNATALTMKWVMELMRTPLGPMYPNHTAKYPGGSGYGNELLELNGSHHGGHFSQGFGAIPEALRPALLWTYNHVVEPGETKRYAANLPAGEKSYDALLYPLRAVLAFVNWPIGVAERNPAELIPRVMVDTVHRHYLFRNRWQDEDDTLVALLLGARTSDRAWRLCVWGLKDRVDFGSIAPSAPIWFKAYEDGSGSITTDNGTSIGVDCSRTSGADVLVIVGGPAAASAAAAKPGRKSRIDKVVVGSATYAILTVTDQEVPAPVADGNSIRIGKQTVSFDGSKIQFATMGKELAAPGR